MNEINLRKVKEEKITNPGYKRFRRRGGGKSSRALGHSMREASV